MRRWLGVLRSLVVYWRPGRQRGLRTLYAPFVAPGDLVFDVGLRIQFELGVMGVEAGHIFLLVDP